MSQSRPVRKMHGGPRWMFPGGGRCPTVLDFQGQARAGIDDDGGQTRESRAEGGQPVDFPVIPKGEWAG